MEKNNSVNNVVDEVIEHVEKGEKLKQIDKKEPSPEILEIKARVVSGKSFPLPENIQCSF